MECSFPQTIRAKVCILVEDTINLRDKGGVGHQFRGDGIIDTLMGIGSTILKHKDLIGSTTSAVGNVVGAIKSIKDAQKESHKLQEIKKGKTQLSPQERQKIIQTLGSGFQKF